MNSQEELNKLKVVDLKSMLRQKGLKLTGVKKDLIERLLNSQTEQKSEQKSDQKTIDLTDKVKKLKLGSLIINIHNILGGDPNHKYVQKVAEKANNLPPSEQKNVIEEIKKHIPSKKHPVVKPAQVTKKVSPSKISAKTEKLQEKVVGELKDIKRAKGMNPAFKATLEKIFGK